MSVKQCQIIPVSLSLKNLEDDSKKAQRQIAALKCMIEKSIINTRVDNDGIGHYEFWGFPGYDKGHDWLDIDDSDVFNLTINVAEGIPDEKSVIEFLDDAIDDARFREITLGEDEGELSGNFKLKVCMRNITGNVFTCILTWEIVN